MRLLWLLFQSSRWKAVLGAVCSTLAGMSSAAIAATVAEVVTKNGANLSASAVRFAACWLGYGVGSVASAYLIGRVSQDTIQWLRLDFSRRILATPLATLERTGGKLFTVLVDDINLISGAVERLPSVLAGAATVLGCLLYLLYKSPALTAIFLVLLAFGVVCYVWPLSRMQRLLLPLRQESNRTYVLLQSLHLGLKDLLQSRRRRDAFLDRHLKPVAQRHGSLSVRIRVIETVFGRWGELYLLLCLGALLFTLPRHGLATFAQFGQFMFIVLFMLGALTTVTGYIGTISRVKVSLQQIEEAGIDLAAGELPDDSHAAPEPERMPPIAFRGVRFHYPATEHASGFELGPVDAEFTHPEIVFVAGGNGSGKSTLLKLLTGLYAPNAGEILCGGEPVGDSRRDAYRQLFSVVFSDTHVFDALLGREEDPVSDEAQRLLEAMRLDRRVSFAEGRFSTTDLSQGQRKRLALVVALLEDRPIFVFDEWAADQDPEFRKVFYDQFLPELKRRGRLVVAITHDEHYYDRADRMIRVSEGRIASDTRAAAAPATA